MWKARTFYTGHTSNPSYVESLLIHRDESKRVHAAILQILTGEPPPLSTPDSTSFPLSWWRDSAYSNALPLKGLLPTG